MTTQPDAAEDARAVGERLARVMHEAYNQHQGWYRPEDAWENTGRLYRDGLMAMAQAVAERQAEELARRDKALRAILDALAHPQLSESNALRIIAAVARAALAPGPAQQEGSASCSVCLDPPAVQNGYCGVCGALMCSDPRCQEEHDAEGMCIDFEKEAE